MIHQLPKQALVSLTRGPIILSSFAVGAHVTSEDSIPDLSAGFQFPRAGSRVPRGCPGVMAAKRKSGSCARKIRENQYQSKTIACHKDRQRRSSKSRIRISTADGTSSSPIALRQSRHHSMESVRSLGWLRERGQLVTAVYPCDCDVQAVRKRLA